MEDYEEVGMKSFHDIALTLYSVHFDKLSDLEFEKMGPRPTKSNINKCCPQITRHVRLISIFIMMLGYPLIRKRLTNNTKEQKPSGLIINVLINK